jgi:serine protease
MSQSRRPQSSRRLLATALALAFAAGAGGPALAQAPQGAQRFIVEFKPGAGAIEAARAAIAQAGGRIRLQIIGEDAVAADLPARALAKLKAHPHIASITEDAKRYPLALTSPSGPPYKLGQLVPYGIPLVQADQLPSGDANAGNRTLCIIDSGYDRSHEDLSGNAVTGEYDKGSGWWYEDDVHHGTHVAGTIAALDNAGIGVVGVNPGGKLKLHIVKVFGAEGWTYSSNLQNAAKKCQAARANVISMSLGGPLNNPLENRVFKQLYSAGILSIAAAGNGGNNRVSYPAGYPTVVSVAALDEHKVIASFSQFNKDVEIAAPGVSVLSTVPMGTGSSAALTVGSTIYAPGGMDGSPQASVSAPLANFGLGDAVDTSVAGKVCLIQRGTITFADKVLNCQNSGGVGAVVYNNVAGGFGGSLGGVVTTIPSATASDTEGAAMLGQLGQTATLSVTASNYAYFDGTSMATPHVSGVAALVWSYFPGCTNAQVRLALNASALDLGSIGRDIHYGYGLVQAKAAYDKLLGSGCGN